MFELTLIEQKSEKLRVNQCSKGQKLKNPSSQLNGKKDF